MTSSDRRSDHPADPHEGANAGASPCSQAPLYCLGMLDDEQTADFLRHLATCGACGEEVARSLPVLASLGVLAGSEAPPPALKQRLMSRLEQRDPIPSDLPRIIPADAGSWAETDTPGASTRLLFSDAATGRSTFLVRMQPGTAFPRHSHQGYEECFVLEGSVRVGDELLRAGDFQRVEDGSVHDVHSTDDGCLLLVMAGGTQSV